MQTKVFNKRFPRSLITSVASSFLIVSAAVAPAQGPPDQEAAANPGPPGQHVLEGDDARRVEDLQKAVAAALKADR
jgi:hypothetical protein